MGVSDRDYMRGKPGATGGAGTVTPGQLIWWLIALNLAVFLLPTFTGWGYAESPSGGQRMGGFSAGDLLRGHLWTLFTYQFVHQDLLHLALNMLGLYFLGRHVAASLGVIPFLALYLAGGVSGALLEALFKTIFGVSAHIVGASAAVSAVLAAFVSLLPHARLHIFPLPVPIPARVLLWAFLGGNALLGLLFLKADGPSTAYFAHCGGALYGILHAKHFRNGFPAFRFARRKPRPAPVRYSPRPGDDKVIDAQFSDDPVDGDYNAVLDKINREGIASLTPRERRILEAASEKLSREKR